LYPNYCLEDLSTKKNRKFKLGIPEVCFCDIPITMADLFLEKYGKYALAFSKQWGVNKGCNPVQYVSNEQIIDGAIQRDKYLQELLKKIVIQVMKKEEPDLNDQIKAIDDVQANIYALGFMKKYKSSDYETDYVNYDENEWRYIIGDEWFRSEKEYIKWRGKNNYISKKTGKLVKAKKKPRPIGRLKLEALRFTPLDINHIIVYEESEIPSLISEINELTQIGTYVLDDFQKSILISKISSFERIKLDF